MNKQTEDLALRRGARSCPGSRVLGIVLALALALPGFASLTGCQHKEERTGAYAPTTTNNCLPDISLIDQHGNQVSLASLKGKTVLFDFIYTTCPGPCLMLTSRMRLIANRLGPMLGDKVWFVSITVDPEHDGPAELLNYSKQQGAEQNGWLFLSGSPAQIEQVMSQFRLVRQREADGTVDHVLEFFLVGPDGRQLYQYTASHAEPTTIAADIERETKIGTVSRVDSASRRVPL